MDNGKRIIMDEFDSKMHPLLTCKSITLFNSKGTNPKNAQLIFTTHDTNLLSANIFRRDQIWFTQKDRYGATELYTASKMMGYADVCPTQVYAKIVDSKKMEYFCIQIHKV